MSARTTTVALLGQPQLVPHRRAHQPPPGIDAPSESATITLTVYQHVHPGMGRQAADRFAALLEG